MWVCLLGGNVRLAIITRDRPTFLLLSFRMNWFVRSISTEGVSV